MSDQRWQTRVRLRQRRARIAPTQRRRAGVAVIRRFFAMPSFARARNVALYSATGSEFDVWPLIHASQAARKRVFLPRVRGTAMQFCRYRNGDKLRVGAFGIREPADSSPPVSILTLDCVVTPLVGFDDQGHRLGQGGGYYDRAFAHLPHRNWRRPKLLGVAFDIQRCDQITAAPWDVDLDAIVTDKRVYCP